MPPVGGRKGGSMPTRPHPSCLVFYWPLRESGPRQSTERKFVPPSWEKPLLTSRYNIKGIAYPTTLLSLCKWIEQRKTEFFATRQETLSGSNGHSLFMLRNLELLATWASHPWHVTGGNVPELLSREAWAWPSCELAECNLLAGNVLGSGNGHFSPVSSPNYSFPFQENRNWGSRGSSLHLSPGRFPALRASGRVRDVCVSSPHRLRPQSIWLKCNAGVSPNSVLGLFCIQFCQRVLFSVCIIAFL